MEAWQPLGHGQHCQSEGWSWHSGLESTWTSAFGGQALSPGLSSFGGNLPARADPGTKGAHPGWMGMGTRRRKLRWVCFCLRLFRTQEQTFPTSHSEYWGLRFNLQFIHMLMRPRASLSRSCCSSFPKPFLSQKSL